MLGHLKIWINILQSKSRNFRFCPVSDLDPFLNKRSLKKLQIFVTLKKQTDTEIFYF